MTSSNSAKISGAERDTTSFISSSTTVALGVRYFFIFCTPILDNQAITVFAIASVIGDVLFFLYRLYATEYMLLTLSDLSNVV